MIPGLVLLTLAALMLWRGWTGQSPIEEIRKLFDGEAIFVTDGSASLVGHPTATDEETTGDGVEDDRTRTGAPGGGGAVRI